MLYEDVYIKSFVRLWVALLNKMLFGDLQVGSFILAPC